MPLKTPLLATTAAVSVATVVIAAARVAVALVALVAVAANAQATGPISSSMLRPLQLRLHPRLRQHQQPSNPRFLATPF